MGSFIPNPQAIPYVSKNASIGEIEDILFRDGVVCIENLETPELMHQIAKEFDPYLEKARALKLDGVQSFQDSLPSETERTRMVGCSTTGDKLLMHPKVIAVLDAVLSAAFPFYFGEKMFNAVSKPQLAACSSMRCPPGTPAQGLHRDDSFNHTVHPGPESQITALWAGSDGTKENGATQVIVGSHRWDNKENPNLHRNEIVYAEMTTGSVLLMVGGLYHAGGANTTADETRQLFSFFYNKGYLRQEENSYISIPREVVRSKTKDVQAMLGYSISNPGAGYFNGEDPQKYLRDPGEDMSGLRTEFFEGF